MRNLKYKTFNKTFPWLKFIYYKKGRRMRNYSALLVFHDEDILLSHRLPSQMLLKLNGMMKL